MTKKQFAALLDITVRRVNQMIAEHLIVLIGKKIDPIPSLVKLLKAAQTGNANRDARANLTRQQIRGAELRNQRLLKKWLSVDEFESVLFVMTDGLHKLGQQCATDLFVALNQTMDETAARIEAYKVQRYMQHAARCFAAGGREVCASIRSDMLQNTSRIAHEFAKLLPTADETKG